MDEPTSGLDVSVQARLLDLIRGLVFDLGLAVVVVTHDLAVARLISHRTLVMKDGPLIESGLTDRVLDDPRCRLHPAARLLGPARVIHHMNQPTPILVVSAVDKTFTMHLQGGQHLAVLERLGFEVFPGECVVLGGRRVPARARSSSWSMATTPSTAGRSCWARARSTSPLRTRGRWLAARRHTMGYVSQFLRCVPRIPALQVVAEPLVERGVAPDEARERAAGMLTRLSIPPRLWSLPPATFSGGEQQRVNIARGFLPELPLCSSTSPRRRSTPATGTP